MGSGEDNFSILISCCSSDIFFCFNSLIYWVADADMEDYGFEYSDDDGDEQDVDIENQYYNSKGCLYLVDSWIFFDILIFLFSYWLVQRNLD